MRIFLKIVLLCLIVTVLASFLCACISDEDEFVANGTSKKNQKNSSEETSETENSRETRPENLADDRDEDFQGGDFIIID